MAAVRLEMLVRIKLEVVLFEQLVHVSRVLRETLLESRENFIRGREVGPTVAAVGEFVEIGPVVREFVYVGLEEIFPARVECFHITVKELFRHLRVQRLEGILHVLQKPRGFVGDARVIGSGLQDSRRRRGRWGDFWRGASEGDKQAKRHHPAKQDDGRETFCLQATHNHGHNFDPM